MDAITNLLCAKYELGNYKLKLYLSLRKIFAQGYHSDSIPTFMRNDVIA